MPVRLVVFEKLVENVLDPSTLIEEGCTLQNVDVKYNLKLFITSAYLHC